MICYHLGSVSSVTLFILGILSSLGCGRLNVINPSGSRGGAVYGLSTPEEKQVQETHRLLLAGDTKGLLRKLESLDVSEREKLALDYQAVLGFSLEWAVSGFPINMKSVVESLSDLAKKRDPFAEERRRFSLEDQREILKVLNEAFYEKVSETIAQASKALDIEKSKKLLYPMLALLGDEQLRLVGEHYQKKWNRSLANDLGVVEQRLHSERESGLVKSSEPAAASELRIAFIVSTKGYHWEEVCGAFKVFRNRGVRVDFYTADGLAPRPDAVSLMYNRMGSSIGLGLSPDQLPTSDLGKEILDGFSRVQPVSALQQNISQYGALYLPGGHGSYLDMNRNPDVHKVIEGFANKQKPLGAVCHATSTLGGAKLSDGSSFIEGRRVTGFPSLADDFTLKAGLVLKQFDPPFNNDAELEKYGARNDFVQRSRALVDFHFFVVDRRSERSVIVSGVGPKASDEVATAMIDILLKD